MLRVALIAAMLLATACGSPGLPDAYRSKSLSGTVDCTIFPEPPAPASCRNLYDDAIHSVERPSIGALPSL